MELIYMRHLIWFAVGVDCGENPQWRIEKRGALGFLVIHSLRSCWAYHVPAVVFVNSIDLDSYECTGFHFNFMKLS